MVQATRVSIFFVVVKKFSYVLIGLGRVLLKEAVCCHGMAFKLFFKFEQILLISEVKMPVSLLTRWECFLD